MKSGKICTCESEKAKNRRQRWNDENSCQFIPVHVTRKIVVMLADANGPTEQLPNVY